MVTDIFAYAYVTAIVSCLHAYVIKFLHNAAYCGFIMNLWEPIFVDLILLLHEIRMLIEESS